MLKKSLIALAIVATIGGVGLSGYNNAQALEIQPLRLNRAVSVRYNGTNFTSLGHVQAGNWGITRNVNDSWVVTNGFVRTHMASGPWANREGYISASLLSDLGVIW